MKKVALLLATLMVISLLPMAVSATEVTVAGNNLKVTAYGGTVNNAGTTIDATARENAADVTAVLTDGNYWTYPVAVARHNSGGNYTLTNSVNDLSLMRFVRTDMTAADRYIEFSWEGDMPVRRLDIWYGERDAIRNGIDIQIPDGNGGWKSHAYFTTGVYQSVVLATSEYGLDRQASYAPILFDPLPEGVNSMRMVIEAAGRELRREQGITFAEVRLSTDNEYNFTEYGRNAGVIGVDSNYTRQCWGQQYRTGNVIQKALVSASTAPYDINDSGMYNTNNFVWPTHRDADKGTTHYVTANAKGECWYAADVNQSYFKLKVNRVRVALNQGTADGFDVYYCDRKDDTYLNQLVSGELNLNGFALVASYSGPITPAAYAELDIPSSVLGSHWLVVMKKPSTDIQLSAVEMHQFAETELAAAPAGGALSGTVAPGKTVKYTASFENAENEEASILFALYEGDKLVDIAAPGAIKMNGTGRAGASYTIPSDAAASGLTVKAFLWNNLNDLQPLQAPITLAQ